jgi:hypothetical protein
MCQQPIGLNQVDRNNSDKTKISIKKYPKNGTMAHGNGNKYGI